MKSNCKTNQISLSSSFYPGLYKRIHPKHTISETLLSNKIIAAYNITTPTVRLPPCSALTNQSAKHERSQLLENDGVAWLVSLEYFMWQETLQSITTHASSLQLLSGFVWCLSLHQSLSLSQEVGHQDLKQAENPIQ